MPQKEIYIHEEYLTVYWRSFSIVVAMGQWQR